MSSSDYLKAMLNQDLEKEKKRKQDYQASKKAAAMTPNEKARRSGAQRDETALNRAGKSLIPAPSKPAAKPASKPAPAKTGNWFTDVQRDIYNSTLKPVQDFTSRVAARIADPFNIGPAVMPKAPNVPEFVKDTMKPAQTTSEKTADIVGNIAGLVAPTGLAYKTGGKLAGKVASNLGNKALPTLKTSMPKVAQALKHTATGAGAGAAYGIANETADSIFDTRNDGSQSLAQRAGNVGLEATLFGSTDGLLNMAGQVLKHTGVADKAGQIASKVIDFFNPKPASSPFEFGTMNQTKSRPMMPGTQSKPMIKNPFNTDAFSASSVTKPRPVYEQPTGVRNFSDKELSFLDMLKQNNTSIHDIERNLQAKADQHLNDELTYLATSQKQGVSQGNLIRDEHGNVVDRTGRISNNPQWYQEFHAHNGRAPSQKELVDLAYKRLREGSSEAPANHEFIKAENALNAVKAIKQKAGIEAPKVNHNDFKIPGDYQITKEKPLSERLSFGQVNTPKLRQLVQESESKRINQEVNKPGEYTVYRRDNAGANLNPEAKPHGLYVSWVKDKNTFETPFEHVGNSDFHGKVTPKNPLIAKEVVIQHKRFGTGRSGAVSAGVSALKDLVPEQRFNELIKMNKNQVTDVLKHEFPGHDYTKYGDSYELLEAYGSMLARKKGHDAIVLEDLEDPSFSEIVVLKNDILKLDNKNSVKPEVTTPPRVEKPNYIQLREAAMKLKNQNNKVQAPLKRKEIATNPMNSMNATEYTPNKLQEAIRRPKLEPTIPEASQMKGDLFTNLFGNQGVGASALKSTKQIRKGPLTTEGQIVKNGIKNDKQGIKEAVNAQARATYQNFVDRLSPLKTISNKTYDTAMDASRANNIANTIIHDKFVTPEGKVVGSGLKEIFNKVARGQDKQFVDYLTLRHALTRMQRGERVYAEQLGMTPEKVKERIKMYNERHPGFAAIAKEWDGFHANMLKNYGVDEGLISPELYKALREKNPNYSPMRRQFSRSEKPGKSFLAKTTSASFSGQKAPIKEVSPTGSVRNIIDPRKSTIESVGAWANVAMRNRVMQSMVDAIKRNPEAFNGIAEIVQKPKNATDLRKVLIDGGEDDFVEALNGDFVNLFKTTKVDGENIVRAMVKGEPVYLQVHDPEVVKTLINMGPQASNLLIDVFSSLSNLTKRGATGALAPVFAVKGATMDLVQSAIQAKNPVQQAAYTVHAIFSGIGDKLNIPGLKNMAEEFRLAGGEYSAALKGDKPLNKSISDMTRYPLLSPKSVAKGLGNTVKMPFKALESIGNIAENAPRMAAYKGELKRLGGEKTPDNVRQAMSAAREITTNFSRKGAVSNDIEAFVPYSNAAVQGTYRVMRAFKDNPIRTTAAVATLAVVPKMMEFMQFHDDPDYNNLPARERSRFLIVHKNEDGTFVKIPMEPAYNSIGYITTEALRKYMDNNPNAFKGAADALANAWTPPLVTGALQGVTQDGGLEKSIAGTINSTVMAPFVATTANQSFTGAPIVSKAVADRSPQYQYDERTSNIAKKLGQYTGMSPMKVDYLIRAYGGDPARLLLPLTSDIGQGNTRNTVLRNFIVDPAYTNTMTNDFYTAKDKLSRAYRDNQEVGVPLPDWYDDKLRKSLTSTAKHSVSHKLSNLSDQKKKLNADTSLSPTEKAAKLKEIQQETNQIYLDINSKLLEKGIIK